MNISAEKLDSFQLNRKIKAAVGTVHIDHCFGQRYIGSGMKEKTLVIHGTPGNALGSYLDGATIVVYGNGQDAVGDTMNSGQIIIHGHAGDGLGYAMRGGSIFVRGNAGCRVGIHMKQYQDQKPAIVIGGKVGSFLGEYMAGGLIVVLGLDEQEVPVGDFIGTGMHGGCIYVRSNKVPANVSAHVSVQHVTSEDMQEILPLLAAFAKYFGINVENLAGDEFYLVKPNTSKPYAQLYTKN